VRQLVEIRSRVSAVSVLLYYNYSSIHPLRIFLKKFSLIFFISLLYALNINAQFDSLIFYKDGLFLDYNYRNIHTLGDQNSDGYDDIMIYDCELKAALVFFGGNPMDIIPAVIIPINLAHSIDAVDLNDDGKDDIVLSEKEDLALVVKIKIYWGGTLLDSIPDIIFSPISNRSGGVKNINDFNGDGRDEFVIYDNFETSDGDIGRYSFYNTESEFDTIPHYVISGDSINNIRLNFGLDYGDLNGDSKSDITIYARVGDQPPYSYYRNFYLGNENWDLIVDQVFYQDQQTFDLGQMRIIKDINGDDKDDLLIKAYGGVYPYYWLNSILHGSFPVDTLQDVGLNTQYEAINLATDARVGDVNGDGFNDLMVQTYAGYPDVKLWLGSSTMYKVPAQEWEGTSAGFGRSIAAVGDVNGDSVNDFAICEISFGPPFNCSASKVYIFMGDTSVVTTVEEKSLILPEEFKLFDPYPNPFNPTTVINWQLAVSSHIIVKIYDILGKEIAELINEEQPAGDYKIEFNAGKYNLVSGIYFIELNLINNKQQLKKRKKVVLIK
jgi:hypothetical protein